MIDDNLVTRYSLRMIMKILTVTMTLMVMMLLAIILFMKIMTMTMKGCEKCFTESGGG